jgi:hypothetical protein
MASDRDAEIARPDHDKDIDGNHWNGCKGCIFDEGYAAGLRAGSPDTGAGLRAALERLIAANDAWQAAPESDAGAKAMMVAAIRNARAALRALPEQPPSDQPECWTCGRPCGHVYATPIERPEQPPSLDRLCQCAMEHSSDPCPFCGHPFHTEVRCDAPILPEQPPSLDVERRVRWALTHYDQPLDGDLSIDDINALASFIAARLAAEPDR